MACMKMVTVEVVKVADLGHIWNVKSKRISSLIRGGTERKKGSRITQELSLSHWKEGSCRPLN